MFDPEAFSPGEAGWSQEGMLWLSLGGICFLCCPATASKFQRWHGKLEGCDAMFMCTSILKNETLAKVRSILL